MNKVTEIKEFFKFKCTHCGHDNLKILLSDFDFDPLTTNIYIVCSNCGAVIANGCLEFMFPYFNNIYWEGTKGKFTLQIVDDENFGKGSDDLQKRKIIKKLK